MSSDALNFMFWGSQVLGGLFVLCAFFGSSRPLQGVIPAALTFLLVVTMWSNASGLQMGMAIFILGSLVVLPLVAFAATLVLLRKRQVTRLSSKARIALVLACIVTCIGGYAGTEYLKPGNVDQRAREGIDLAIRDANPGKLTYWRSYQTQYKRNLPLEKILKVHGVSEKTYALLASEDKIYGATFEQILKFPKTPERQLLLQQLVTKKTAYPAEGTYIQLMDAGDTETVEILYPYFPRSLDEGMVKAKRLDLLREVLRRGPPSNDRSKSGSSRDSAVDAAASRQPEYMEALLAAGRKPDAATLQIACSVTCENAGVAKMLLAAGVEPNGTDKKGSPLQTAIAKGTDDLVNALLAAKADPRFVNANGRTPLHTAAMFGNIHALKELLKQKVSVSAADGTGLTPLHWAAWRGDPDACALLIAAGAPVDTAGKDGRTPLFHAAYQGHAPAMNALLKKVPDARPLLAMKDLSGNTPLDLAASGPYEFALSGPYGQWYGFLKKAGELGIPPESFGVSNTVPNPASGVWLKSLERRVLAVSHLLEAGADPTRSLTLEGRWGQASANVFLEAFSTWNSASLGWGDFPEQRVVENTVKTYVAHDGPTLYSQALEGLLKAGAPLPELGDTVKTYEQYCKNRSRGTLYKECAAILEKESVRRSKVGEK